MGASKETSTKTPNTLLDVINLRAGYGRDEVLHGVSLRAGRGEVVTVIGPNGAGKSTLLNALMGVMPASGQLIFDGYSIALATLEERVAAGIALVPEQRALFGSMSVEDNLLLGAYTHRHRLTRAKERREIERRHAARGESDRRETDRREATRREGAESLNDVYALFPRLNERRGQRAAMLSGDERLMLALGRALMSRPTLLLLDEPSLGLAPLVMREIFKTITALRANGMTILLVEQNARAALEVADHAHVLEMGEVVIEGRAAQLANDPRVIDAYLGHAHQSQDD